MSIQQAISSEFKVSSIEDLLKLFPKDKSSSEKLRCLSNRFTHYLATDTWVDNDNFLNFVQTHDFNFLPFFENKPLENKLKRIQEHTFTPKTTWTEFYHTSVEFFNEFRASPTTVGAILPSFKPLAKAIVKDIPKRKPDSDEPGRKILEVGPGTGAFTKKLLTRMGKNDVLHLVELDVKFCKKLEIEFADQIKNGRLKVFNKDILQHQETDYDHIVSGLPLNIFPVALVSKIFLKFLQLSKDEKENSKKTTLAYFEYLLIPDIMERFSTIEKVNNIRAIKVLKNQFHKEHFKSISKVYYNAPSAQVRHHRLNKINFKG